MRITLLLASMFLACAAPAKSNHPDYGRGIAATLDRCLTEQAPRLRAQGERPLAWRCACVSNAEKACAKVGLPKNCAFDGLNIADRLDGWKVADLDAWTVAVCKDFNKSF